MIGKKLLMWYARKEGTMRFFAIGLRGVAVCLLLLCTLLVSGNVTLAQNVSTSPASLGFGVPNGSTVSAPLSLTITVSGDAVTFSTFTVSDTTHFAISSNTCSPGPISGNCVVGVTFTPVTPGLKSATLNFGTISAPAGFSVPLIGALGAINVLGETDVNPSGPGPFPVTYGSQTLSLSCPAGAPPTGTLSSTPDGLGFILEDNYLVVAVNGTPVPSGAAPAGNVCTGPDNDGGNLLDCYSDPYRNAASAGSLNGVNADSIASPNNGNNALGGQAAGNAPINISSFLSSLEGTTGSVSFSALDYGGWIAGSSVFLVTNCTNVTTITQPATPAPATYTFNQAPDQVVSQVVALGNNAVITPDTNLAVTDTPINPADFPALVANTSFAVDNCFIMAGETIPTQISNVVISGGVLTLTVASTRGLSFGEAVGLSGLANATFLNGQTITITGLGTNANTVTANFTYANYSATDTGTLAIPACKQYQILCTTPANPIPSGANCPVSTARDEFYSAVFNPANLSILAATGPGSTLPLINGTIPAGVAYPMAIDTWAGGPCVFPATDANLTGALCPQNFLTSFSSVGDPSYSTTITTKNPNSTVIPMYGHPQQVTGVTLPNQNAAGWNNTSTVTVNFSTQAPFLGSPAPNNFVPAPIAKVTLWANETATDTNTPPSNALTAQPDATLSCPSPQGPFTPPTSTPSPFLSSAIVSGLHEGANTLYYFSTDCAGTEELKLSKTFPATPPATDINWGTSFFTKTINVDTVPPVITVTTPGAGATYTANQKVKASYSCSDTPGSGIASCSGPVANNSNFDTTPTAGLSTPKSFTVTALDKAGNPASSTVNYTVSCNYASVGISPSTVKRPALVLITASVVDCKTASQSVKVQFTLSGPIAKNCGNASTVLFTSSAFTIKSGTSSSIPFLFPIAKAACAGTYTVTTTTLQGSPAVPIDTVSSTLVVQ
jgi:hypothetical protein